MWLESEISEMEDNSTESLEDSSETDVNTAFKLFFVIWKKKKKRMWNRNRNRIRIRMRQRFVPSGASSRMSPWISDWRALEFGALSFRSVSRDDFEFLSFTRMGGKSEGVYVCEWVFIELGFVVYLSGLFLNWFGLSQHSVDMHTSTNPRGTCNTLLATYTTIETRYCLR